MKKIQGKMLFTGFLSIIISSFLFCSEYFRRIDPREQEEQAELWKALEDGNVVYAVELLRSGANPNARGVRFMTVLEYAAMKGYQEIIEILLNATIPLSTEQEHSAFDYAIQNNQQGIVQLLLAGGVNPNVQDDILLYTPLMLAVMNNKLEIVRLLLEHGVDTTLTDRQGRTVLEIARANNAKEIVALIEDVERK